MAIYRVLSATYCPVQILECSYQIIHEKITDATNSEPPTKTKCNVVEVGLLVPGGFGKVTLGAEGCRIGVYTLVEGHSSSKG